MDEETHTPENNVHYAILIRLMLDNGLTHEDLVLLVKRHLNDLKFEKDLEEVYEGDDWDSWTEGDLI